MTRSGTLNAARTSLSSPLSGPSGWLPVMIVRRAKAGVAENRLAMRPRRMTRRIRSPRKVTILLRRAKSGNDYQPGDQTGLTDGGDRGQAGQATDHARIGGARRFSAARSVSRRQVEVPTAARIYDGSRCSLR